VTVEDRYKAEPMHPNCVACHALAGPDLDSVDTTLVCLCTVARADSLTDVIQDLCFAHRRRFEDLVRDVAKELDE
jgi:hypothetical protein